MTQLPSYHIALWLSCSAIGLSGALVTVSLAQLPELIKQIDQMLCFSYLHHYGLHIGRAELLFSNIGFLRTHDPCVVCHTSHACMVPTIRGCF